MNELKPQINKAARELLEEAKAFITLDDRGDICMVEKGCRIIQQLILEAETPEPAPEKQEAARVLSEIEELAIDYVAGGANRAIITDGAAALRRYIEASGVPEEYAPAQLIEIAVGDVEYTRDFLVLPAGNTLWNTGLRHRPAIRDFLPVVSAEGLAEWARYVAADKSGIAWQYEESPVIKFGSDNIWDSVYEDFYSERAPDTHRLPGDWRQSLAAVEGR
jgi:hypothetical protein